jgi:hypothetical protein
MDIKQLPEPMKHIDDDKAKSLGEIHSRTLLACGSNDIKDIQQILLTDCYPNLTQEEKETNVFVSTIVSLEYTQLGHEILRYLILDYGIKEDHSVKGYNTEEAKELFTKRELNKELNSELGDKNKSSKKPKV